MIILMKCLDEEKAVDRVISNFHDESFVDRIIVIDGASTDYTVQALSYYSKVETFVHPWIDWYHDMEIIQSNIALSYVPHGKLCFILDFDEKISDELKVALHNINKKGLATDTGHVARRTFDLMRFPDSPHAMLDKDGWPILSNQIGQYPDYQCRLIKRIPGMTWMNSPHHQLSGPRELTTTAVPFDIIHYEKDDSRDRVRIEKKWARAQARRKELGLTCDVFECKVKPELHKFTKPETWA